MKTRKEGRINWERERETETDGATASITVDSRGWQLHIGQKKTPARSGKKNPKGKEKLHITSAIFIYKTRESRAGVGEDRGDGKGDAGINASIETSFPYRCSHMGGGQQGSYEAQNVWRDGEWHNQTSPGRGDKRASSTEISHVDICADQRHTVKNDSSLGAGIMLSGLCYCFIHILFPILYFKFLLIFPLYYFISNFCISSLMFDIFSSYFVTFVSPLLWLLSCASPVVTVPTLMWCTCVHLPSPFVCI